MTKHTAGSWSYHFEPTLNRHVIRADIAGERNICIDRDVCLLLNQLSSKDRSLRYLVALASRSDDVKIAPLRSTKGHVAISLAQIGTYCPAALKENEAFAAVRSSDSDRC